MATDISALAVVVLLPWSISAMFVSIGVWLIAAIVALKPADIRREVTTRAGGMPVLLIALGLAGTLWAHIEWAERLGGVEAFLKLLAIPLLFAQFRRSPRAAWHLFGFLGSCAALLILFWALTIHDIIFPAGPAQSALFNKNSTTEMGEFILCGFVLLYLATRAFRDKRPMQAAGMAVLAVGFLAFVVYVLAMPSRWFIVAVEIGLALAAVLLLFVLKQISTKAKLALIGGCIVASAVVYAASPMVQSRMNLVDLFGRSRAVYWPKSVNFIADAPIIGHGTGSIRSLFERAAQGQTGISAEIATNPFQETLAIGIQLGSIGIIALWAMWFFHLRLFRAESLADWIGLSIVAYTIVASMADSELFDAHRGWIYVFGVGIAGGTVLQARRDAAASG